MINTEARFVDRVEAGRKLAEKLVAMKLENPVVYALPRGGIPIGVVIAEALHAPLDLVLVRKIGAPGQPELAMAAIVDGPDPQTVINDEVFLAVGSDHEYLERAKRTELAEIERRRQVYFGDHPRVEPKGRAAIVVDDGLATGTTAKAALRALKNQGATRTILAVPVSPVETLADMKGQADEIICLNAAERFWGVGGFYDDFHQLSDEEAVGLLKRVWEAGAAKAEAAPEAAAVPPETVMKKEIFVPPLNLAGNLQVPQNPRGIVLFAHGSGSSRFSPRNTAVADSLNQRGFATLLLDLLTEAESRDRRNVFDIPLLSGRLTQAAQWIADNPELAPLKIGLFGASTGAAAALVAAAGLGPRVAAVVSRGGRPDLAGAALKTVAAPTLLIVGAADYGVIELNQQALAILQCTKKLELVPGATHLFEEPGTLEVVMDLAGDWFDQYLAPAPARPA